MHKALGSITSTKKEKKKQKEEKEHSIPGCFGSLRGARMASDLSPPILLAMSWKLIHSPFFHSLSLSLSPSLSPSFLPSLPQEGSSLIIFKGKKLPFPAPPHPAP
jgi:hypothetical protein